MIIANVWTIILSAYATFMMLVYKKELHKYANFWGSSCLWLLKICTDLRVKFYGKIPKNCIIASQHQSALEILALIAVVENPIFVLKKSLTKIPFLGWVVQKLGMIPVDRNSLNRHWIEMAREGLQNNKTLIIFPEGTRTDYGSQAEYRKGVFKLASELKAKIVPVAIDSGKFWPRKTLFKSPGVSKIVFGNAIEANAEILRQEYKNLMENACK